MPEHIWKREETEYPNFPGNFTGVVQQFGDPKLGYLVVTEIVQGPLFTYEVLVPSKTDKKAWETFEKHMSDIMDGVIELKSQRSTA